MPDLDLIDEAEAAEVAILEAEAEREAEMEPLLIREQQAWMADDLPTG